ncbi:MAG: hypothetical protein AABN33_10680 [Acidobacteriota bacterium]
MDHAEFITIETGDDLIVSFALADDEPGEVRSLTLLRTPKYEFILDDAERGVTVSHEDFPEPEHDLLIAIQVGPNEVVITTQTRRYAVDVGRVPEDEMEVAKRNLRKMNFDRRFALRII